MSRFLNASLAAAAIALACTPGVALAGPGSGGGVGSGGTIDEVLVAYVYFTETGGGGSGCRWVELQGALPVGDGSASWPHEKNGVTYRLWQRTCSDKVDYFEFPDVDTDDLLDQVLDRLNTQALPTPEPVFELLDPVNNWAYVRVPVDFRAGGDAWRSVTVTAAIGPFWATVTAEPTSLTFASGDPAAAQSSVSCSGDGPVAEYAPERPGECSYTYVNASSTSPYDGYHFLTTMTIDWAISWNSSSGAGGPLDSLTTSSTAELAVAEVKGIVTCTGSRPEEGSC